MVMGEGCENIVAFYLPMEVAVEGWSRCKLVGLSEGGGKGCCHLLRVCIGEVVVFEEAADGRAAAGLGLQLRPEFRFVVV